jgi:hypothetical protein
MNRSILLQKKQMTLLIILTIATHCTAMAPTTEAATDKVVSHWLQNPVTPDGEITHNMEWCDTEKHEIILGLNGGKSPPFLRAWIWVKNDQSVIYILLKIEYFKTLQYDTEDQAIIYYLWADDAAQSWDRSDAAWIYQIGSPSDLYNYDGTAWTHDTLAAEGKNNVKGGGYYDSLFYWFEAVKTLNSTDGCDWTLAPGDTVGSGNPSQTSDLLYVGLYDDSQGKRFENRVIIALSTQPRETSPPVGGSLEPNEASLRDMAVTVILLALGGAALLRHRPGA